MNFYYSEEENMCADEDWVVNFLCQEYPEISAEEHRKRLQGFHLSGYLSWSPCSVCRTVWEALDKSGIYHSNSEGWD